MATYLTIKGITSGRTVLDLDLVNSFIEGEDASSFKVDLQTVKDKFFDGELTGFTSLSTAISTESSTRISSDTSLSSAISTEISVRSSADTSLSTAIGNTGNVTKVGTPVNNQVGVWTGDGTIEGTTGLTYDGNDLLIDGNVLGHNARRITKIILTSGATTTWNMNDSSSAEVTISGSTTLSISNVVSGDNGTLLIIQEGTGTLTYPFGSRFIGGDSYTLSGDGKIDILSFYYDGSNYYWNIGKDYYEITP